MDAEFLKKHVGTALSKGLAQVVVNQPEDGIDYLGKFLMQYADSQERAEQDIIKKANMEKINAERAEAENAEQERGHSPQPSQEGLSIFSHRQSQRHRD